VETPKAQDEHDLMFNYATSNADSVRAFILFKSPSMQLNFTLGLS